MSPAELWLRGRDGEVPPALLAQMVAALPADRKPVPEALAAAALDLYAVVHGGAGGREDALPLLAADALFTHAFEAQAEIDPEGIDELVVRCESGLGRIAR